MKYSLSYNTINSDDLDKIHKQIDTLNFTMGKKVTLFEKKFSSILNSNFSLMVNSGSSANLIMLAVLSKNYKKLIKEGDNIIVPAVSWSTTYFPVDLFGFKLNFVDIDKNTLNIDPELIERSIDKKTKAIFAVNLLGNPNNFSKLNQICKKHNLILLEDNCESLYSQYNNKFTGTFGIMASFSFFFSHHINTIEGGMINFRYKRDYILAKSLRAHGWIRDLENKKSIIKKNKIDEFYENFYFISKGFNLRPTEINAVLGLNQIKKVKKFINQRIKNYLFLKDTLKDNKYLNLQKTEYNSSWFAFAILLSDHAIRQGYNRDTFVKFLKSKKIETRPIVAGNILKNPVIKELNYVNKFSLKNSDFIHYNGFYIGNGHVDLTKEIIYFNKISNEFFLN